MSKKNDSKPANKRRDALRKLAVSGGVIGAAGTWSKPVVDSVILPAHAQTSLPLQDPCTGISIEGLVGTTTFNVIVSGLVEGANNAGIPLHVEVRVSGGPFGPHVITKNTVTNSTGHYNVTVGQFDGCDGTNVHVTISSSAFAGVATCTATATKECV